MSVGTPGSPYTGEGHGYVVVRTDIATAGSATNLANPVAYVPDRGDIKASMDTTETARSGSLHAIRSSKHLVNNA